MTTVNIRETIDGDIQLVWDVVTCLNNYTWRSDLDKIEIVKENECFIEYTKGGYSTTFNITKFEPLKVYEFSMKNKSMTGSWSGKFYSENGKTVIDFTENVSTKNIIMKLFIKRYLTKHQEKYINDLKGYIYSVS